MKKMYNISTPGGQARRYLLISSKSSGTSLKYYIPHNLLPAWGYEGKSHRTAVH